MYARKSTPASLPVRREPFSLTEKIVMSAYMVAMLVFVVSQLHRSISAWTMLGILLVLLSQIAYIIWTV
jgi:cell division protein FtsL